MGFFIAIDLKAINKLFCIINCKIKGMVRYRVPCFPNLPDPRSAARNTVLAAWIFTFFPFSPCFHSALFCGIFVSGSSFFNSYLQFSSSPPVFCHSKFLHLGAFLVIILLLSVFVVAFFFFFFFCEGERVKEGNELQWASVSCRFREEWPTWAHSDQPWLNCFSIYLHPEVGLWERAAHTNAFQGLPRSAMKATGPPLLNSPHLSRNSPAVKLLCTLSSHWRLPLDIRCLTRKPVPAPHSTFCLQTR